MLATLLLPSLVQLATAPAPAPTQAPTPERRSIELRLWDPEGPCCILYERGDGARAPVLPAPVAPRRISELLGPGVTEDTLAAGQLAGSERPPKKLLGGGGAAFLVVYTDASGEGFWDAALGAQRRAAFEYGAQRVVDMIQDTDLVVSIDASMALLGTGSGAVLASGAATAGWMDSALPFAGTWYGEPLFSHLTGSDPDTDQLDIGVSFNASWDLSSTPWYYGLDSGASAAQYHFVSVTFHELVHGLDFTSTFTAGGGLSFAEPFVFDHFCVDASGTKLITLPDVPSTVTGDDVFWSGAVARLGWQNHLDESGRPPLFAPTPFDMASSISHWDEATFEEPWDLMTPNASLGAPLLLPDAITRGLLTDLGWKVSFHDVYVAPQAVGSQTGKPHEPFGSLPAGLSSAATLGKGHVFLSNGAYDVSALVIDQQVTLHGWPGAAVVE
jgi:hypothetical protein